LLDWDDWEMDALLFKFGKKAPIEQFRAGLLYLNTQKYFAQSEADAVLRTDVHEGLGFIHQPGIITSLVFSFGDKKVEMAPRLTGPFRGGRIENQCNLFCMYALTEIEAGQPVIDPRVCRFGDSYTIISKTHEFLDRVNAAAKKAGLEATWDLVEYPDFKTYSGDVSAFQKSSDYAYQREFRIAVYPGATGPIQLQVGSLEDITTPILLLEDITTSLQIVRNNPRAEALKDGKRRSRQTHDARRKNYGR
jgi:hypothetical protein